MASIATASLSRPSSHLPWRKALNSSQREPRQAASNRSKDRKIAHDDINNDIINNNNNNNSNNINNVYQQYNHDNAIVINNNNNNNNKSQTTILREASSNQKMVRHSSCIVYGHVWDDEEDDDDGGGGRGREGGARICGGQGVRYSVVFRSRTNRVAVKLIGDGDNNNIINNNINNIINNNHNNINNNHNNVPTTKLQQQHKQSKVQRSTLFLLEYKGWLMMMMMMMRMMMMMNVSNEIGDAIRPSVKLVI